MKFKTIYLVFLIVLVYLLFVFCSINKPYMGDETEWIKTAKAIAETGNLTYKADFFAGYKEGLWHPPLYIYLLSIPMYFFGDNTIALRSLSIIFGIATIFLIYFTAKMIVPRKKEFWAVFACLIYAINPLTIQSAIIIDMDGGILIFLTLLFIYIWLKNEDSKYLWLVLFLIFWTKETAIVLLFCSLFGFYLINRSWKQLLKKILMFVSMGIAYFITFYGYCKILGFDYTKPFKALIWNSANTSYLIGIFRSMWSLKIFIYFTIPIFGFLFLYCIYELAKRFFKKRKFEKTDILAIMAILGILMFGYVGVTGWNFPKYYIEVVAFGVLFIIKTLAEKIKNISISKKAFAKLFFFSVLLFVYLFILLKDPIMPEINLSATSVSSILDIAPLMKSFLIYITLPILASLLLFYKNSKQDKQGMYFFIFVLISLSLYINVIQATANYSTHNIYGDIGLKEVVKFANESQISSKEIATYFQVGYYLGGGEYYEITEVYSNKDLFKEKVIENSQIKYMIIYEKDIKRIGEAINYFKLNKIIGSYYIFERK